MSRLFRVVRAFVCFTFVAGAMAGCAADACCIKYKTFCQ